MTKWMKHPVTEAVIEVPDAAVNGHMLSGWRVTDPPPPPVIPDENAPEILGTQTEVEAGLESRPQVTDTVRDGKEK